MYLLAFAVLLTVLKVMEILPFNSIGWGWIVAIYLLASAWWAWADKSGYTKRKAQQRMDDKVQKRIDRQRDALGIGIKKK